ncbi:hypothetical protein [Streptomyces sp. NPDC050145]|uniref:hypothetical protein n=1 Tax=Streptomyces sp. NPDC050145 TaxID=3365602 RepID=UPI0037A1E5FB
MEPKQWNECPVHGAGVRPDYLVGRHLERVLASWHFYGTEPRTGPLDVWLIDSEGDVTHVTTGSDWCLIVETSAPHEGYDMAEAGRVEVAPIDSEFPIAAHFGETILSVHDEADPGAGRLALELTFDSGRVRCDTWSGDMRLSSK